MSAQPQPAAAINQWLDLLPRTRLGTRNREIPAFELCGVVGYHLAVIATASISVASGGALLIVAALAATCAATFFVWAWLRQRLLGGSVKIVLLEHVWFALVCATGVLHAAGVPPLKYLDALSVGLAVFLASGRVGCLLVGCCHGRPSGLGVRYGAAHVRDGFPPHRAHVRLFPVQAIESTGLWCIASVGAAMALHARAGAALAWFLSAYAVMRFGLEGLRGDARPHWRGLSQSRWMCLCEFAAACALPPHAGGHAALRPAAVSLVVIGAAAVILTRWRHSREPPPDLLGVPHLQEICDLVREQLRDGTSAPLRARSSSLGASVAAAETAPGAEHHTAHVSLALPDGAHDLSVLCEMASRAFPEAILERSLLAPSTLLHLFVPLPIADSSPSPDRDLSHALESVVLLRMEPPTPPAHEAHEPPWSAAHRDSYFRSASR